MLSSNCVAGSQMAAYVKDRLQCRSIGAVHQGLCTWPRSSMVIQSIHDILASDPLPVAVMVLWDPDFFLAYAQRGKGALHSSLALIGSDLLSFLQSVVRRGTACYRCHRRNWAWPRKKRSCWKTATLLLRPREVHRSDPAGRCFQPKQPRASLQIL